VHGHLLVVGAGPDHQIAAAASRLEGVPRKARQIRQGLGATVRQTEAGVEQRRPDPEGQRELGRAVADSLASVVRRRERLPGGAGADRSVVVRSKLAR